MDSEINEKIQRYEDFLNNNLKEDLKIIEQRLKTVNEKLANWYLLQKSIKDMRDYHPKGFKTKSDIGCGIHCHVKVTDPSVIYVDVGANVYLAMSLDEADKYCNMRTGLLTKEQAHVLKQANNVKAHIKIVLLGLQELQKL